LAVMQMPHSTEYISSYGINITKNVD